MGAAGKLVIVSGPSGSGKTTVVARVFAARPVPLVASVSATTRPPRQGEVHGKDYHFLSQAEFADRRSKGDFLECCEVFGRGHWYGTLKSEVERGLAEGRFVVLEIDVQGALAVLAQFPDAVTIFIQPATMEELERRLRARQTESEQDIQCRLEAARRELALADRYRHRIINREVAAAAEEICQVLRSYQGGNA